MREVVIRKIVTAPRNEERRKKKKEQEGRVGHAQGKRKETIMVLGKS